VGGSGCVSAEERAGTHLLDAINYVRDGGSIFRRKLGPMAGTGIFWKRAAAGAGGADGWRAGGLPGSGDAAGGEEEPDCARRTPARFRNASAKRLPRICGTRLRHHVGDGDGIRPILDRLDEIEGRVIEMWEEGEQPGPRIPLRLAERGTGRHAERIAILRQGREKRGAIERARYGSASAQLIEEAVTKRFQSMAGKLQEQIEEQHVRTLETFVKNIQVKLVQRVSVLGEEHGPAGGGDAPSCGEI